MPKAWNSFERADFERLVRNLDIHNTGSIEFRVLATCAILLKTPLAKDVDIDTVQRSLQDTEVDNARWLAVNSWFAKTEASRDREYSHPFPRATSIKQILFDLHNRNGLLNIPKLASVLRAAELTMHKSGIVTYGDILAADIKN